MKKQEQFSRALTIIQGRRANALLTSQQRTAEINEKLPAAAEINRRLAETGKALFAAMQSSDPQAQIAAIRRRNEDGQALLRQTLVSGGYPADYLELQYTCSRCHDTGYLETGYCDCLKREAGRLAAAELNEHAQLALCCFDTFSTAYYRTGGPECVETMTRIFHFCRQYAEQFSTASPSLLMIGKTGLGKTHLSLAIANTVIRQGHTVLYDSIINVLRRVEREHFGRDTAEEGTLELLLDCDLLILDDLGAEFDTGFYVSTVYNIINTRLNRNLPTIISTNLTHEEVQKKYEDRIVSRLFAAYTCLAFAGTDIRLQKAKQASQ